MSPIFIELPIITDETWINASNYISKSRVNLFEFCGEKYRKQYIEKSIPYETSHAAEIGLRYHEFMEKFMMVAHKYPTDMWLSFVHPDFTPEEVSMLEWTIKREIIRYNESKDYFTPIGIEYRITDDSNKLRGIIDRIDQINDETINVIEYKTTQSINKRKLQMEFGFYDILLDSIEELNGLKREYTVINPRLQQVVSLKPSRKSTIMRKVEAIHNAITSDDFKPLCGINVDTMCVEYATNFCMLCSLEEIAEKNGLLNFRP